MKLAESRGYTCVERQPTELKVELFEFQKSTLQWMLDQEHDVRGINGRFWENWNYDTSSSSVDGGEGSNSRWFDMYYFPLAGELRLVAPPQTNGGLLCEEMGLGKRAKKTAFLLSM
jgi:SNF2 family DNA or RNA helicase